MQTVKKEQAGEQYKDQYGIVVKDEEVIANELSFHVQCRFDDLFTALNKIGDDDDLIPVSSMLASLARTVERDLLEMVTVIERDVGNIELVQRCSPHDLRESEEWLAARLITERSASTSTHGEKA